MDYIVKFKKGDIMKKLFGSVIVLMLFVGIISLGLAGNFDKPSYAQGSIKDEYKENILVVNGQASYEVSPDLAYVRIGVKTESKDAQQAQNENAQKMNKVRDAINNLGIKREDLKTSNYSVYTDREYISDKKYIDKYVVRNQLIIKIRDLTMVAQVIDECSKAGANQINNVQFAIEDEEGAYQKALQLAMKNAKGKADAILGTFGKNVGTPVRIVESSYGGGGYMRADNGVGYAKSMSDIATPIEQGKLNITANVKVEYYYGK